jgi:flavin-dependent dehydrogenase
VEKLIIVGAGVAGLSCLNALLDAGVSPLLVEGGAIGSPKLCGEFLAPPAVPILQRWDVPGLRLIHQVHFHHAAKPWSVSLSRPAAAIQRHTAELALAAHARQRGGRIREQLSIQHITPASAHTPFKLQCSNGEELCAENIIVATGKVIPTRPARQSYIGFKTYIPRILSHSGLDMFAVPHGYVGVIPVSDSVSNLTGLVQQAVVEKAGGPHAFVRRFLNSRPLLASAEPLSSTWLDGRAPAFGLRAVPRWHGAWWIGDAMAAIHPAIGYGFAHSVASALFASASYLGRQQPKPVPLATVLRLSGLMHQLLQRPIYLGWLSRAVARYPAIPRAFLHYLDY